MTDVLHHRGPDAAGYHFAHDGQCAIGMGHRRLAIIDLSPGGNQPMQFAGGRLRIVFNGEVYNFVELRTQLEGLGHQFVTHSDTEVILHAYAQWGPGALDRFVGMFAFVIHDRDRDVLFCCRDRAGAKPFHYHWDGTRFLFASELKGLMAFPGFSRRIDDSALAAYLAYGYVPAPHSILCDTNKLPAGHWMEVDLRHRTLRSRRYWSVVDCYREPQLDISLPEAIDETERILTRACEARMVADVPVGVFLSGGYDSTALTALLQRNRSERLKTFTIGVGNARLDEAPFARQIAAVLGTDHHEHYCSEDDAREIVSELPWFYDEPLADASAIPTLLVSRFARRHVTVALSGDAGDEVFGGYERYLWMSKQAGRFNALPGPLSRGGAALLERLPLGQMPGIAGDHVFQRRFDKLKALLSCSDAQGLYMGMTEYFSARERSLTLLRPRLVPPSAHDSAELVPGGLDPQAFAMVRDYQTYLVDDVLQKVDRGTMAASLEGREPLVDHRLIAWAARLPTNYKIRNGRSKWILREIVHRHVPAALMDRPKCGFVVPIAEWLRGPLRPLVDHYLGSSLVARQGLFDAAYVDRVRSAFLAGRRENLYKVWFLLVFQLWHERWIGAQ